MRINRHLLSWGSFFVIAGAIPLAVRASLLPADLVRDWASLWPLLLVGSGLGLVLAGTSLRLVGSLVSVVTAGVMVGGFLATGFHGIPFGGACGDSSTASRFAEAGGSVGDRTRFEIELNCGDLDIQTPGPGTPADSVAWSLSGSSPSGRAPNVAASSDRVRITTGDRGNFGFDVGRTTLDLVVPRSRDVDIDLTLNAGSGTIDLAGAVVRRVGFTMNAGSMRADLSQSSTVGEVDGTMNAGSVAVLLPSGSTGASFTVNAGSLTVCVPASAPLRVSWNGALGSNNLDAAGLVRTDDHHWTSAGLGLTGAAITLDVTANAGSFTLLLGDACDA